MESSPPPLHVPLPPVVAGVKRSASLLPAFDPSSSPTLPRPVKRLARDDNNGASTYPTPVPTSSTAIPTSSPPRVRRGLKRTHSMASERSPLSAVPCIMLKENGETVTLGRSSLSCNYQLSANRLVSRVHVKATFKSAEDPFERDRIEILCTGWNGILLHCQGTTYELTKGKTFTSDIRDADVLIDVHDSRVLLQWPLSRKDTNSEHSDQTWDESPPIKEPLTVSRSTPASPLQNKQRLISPVSPTPVVHESEDSVAPSTPSRSRPGKVIVYEDAPSPAQHNSTDNCMSQKAQQASQPLGQLQENSLANSLNKSEEFSEHDEENDPIVFSFGPFGANLLPRFASFRAGDSPVQAPSAKLNQTPARAAPHPSPKQGSSPEYETAKQEIQNHIINQLAFSRLSSTPLSTIVKNLPSDLLEKLPSERARARTAEILSIIEITPCVGKVKRQGKDAAGKLLESEYYYIPDMDDDVKRREAVVDGLRKPGLRNCRKQHKQYFWRRPKTP